LVFLAFGLKQCCAIRLALCGEKQHWLTGVSRVQPSTIGAYMKAGKRTKMETSDEILFSFK